MTTYSQANQPVAIRTALGDDVALLARATAPRRSCSFHFTLDLLAEQPIAVRRPACCAWRCGFDARERLAPRPGRRPRWPEEGTCPGTKGGTTFLRYQAELAPAMWLLGHRKQSRVFQDLSVPDIVLPILKDEWRFSAPSRAQLGGLAGDYQQYWRPTWTSSATARRRHPLHFRHEESCCCAVLADSGDAHPDLGNPLIFDAAVGGRRPEGRVTAWRKRQSLRPTKYLPRDHCFQVPGQAPRCCSTRPDQVRVGQVTHTLDIDPRHRSEVYEHPGGYGWRFDGVGTSGQDQPEYVQNLFKENERLARLRMQEESATAVAVRGESLCGHLFAGGRFTLARHRDGDGDYLLTRVEHRADLEEAYLSGTTTGRLYDNRFDMALQAWPAYAATPRPAIPGAQTAVIVGPPGSDLFVDKYGRVKVKFFWDRNPKTGPKNSCWLRVGQPWAGNRWGAFFWPRVGHEVVVTFLDGDPDRPMVTGSVYNHNNMPPFDLPAHQHLGGIKSFTSTGDVNAPADPLANFNGLVFNDDKAKEQIELHGEKHIAFFGEHSHEHSIDGWHQVNVNGMHRTHVGAMPGGSGSGGGPLGDWDKGGSPPFVYNGTLGGGKIGVSLSTVCGLSQSIVLPAAFALTIGQEFNIVMNPIGLVTDIGAGFAEAAKLWAATGGAIGTALGNVIGGDIDVYFGNYAFMVYGREVCANRAKRTAIYNDLTWDDPLTGKLAVIEPWVKITEVAALIISLMTTGTAVTASVFAYDHTDAFVGSIGACEALTEVLAMIDIYIGTYVQTTKAAEPDLAALIAGNEEAILWLSRNVAALLQVTNTPAVD
ncbi:MAG: type VI secretion system tip protein TssI/VgrG [Gemmataceae bacterium]